MTRRRLVLFALLAGLLAGVAAAAIAAGQDPAAPPAPRAAPSPTPAAIRLGPPRRPDSRLPDGRYDGGYIHTVIERPSLKIERRTADPAGGPGWAVRTFNGERRSIRGDQRTLADPLYRQAMRCVDLVRTYRGRVGWLFADRRFQATTPAAPSPLGDCTSRRRPEPLLRFATVLVFPRPAEPRAERGALYGLAPPGTRAATLTGLPGGAEPLPVGRGGGFLRLVGPEVERDRLAVTFTLRGGGRERLDLRPGGTEPPPFPSGARRPRTLTPIPSTQRAEARAPDPAGGPGWAVPVVETKEGTRCMGPAGQVVGDRIGGVDTIYATFEPRSIEPFECSAIEPRFTARRPCMISYGGGSDGMEDRDPLLRRARVERRLSPGRFEITAQCRADVERVTIRTPRDLRTLVPSARGHVVFALYDGDFPAGDLVVTSHLRSGAQRSERFNAWF